jgi:hypothetical protein
MAAQQAPEPVEEPAEEPSDQKEINPFWDNLQTGAVRSIPSDADKLGEPPIYL